MLYAIKDSDDAVSHAYNTKTVLICPLIAESLFTFGCFVFGDIRQMMSDFQMGDIFRPNSAKVISADGL